MSLDASRHYQEGVVLDPEKTPEMVMDNFNHETQTVEDLKLLGETATAVPLSPPQYSSILCFTTVEALDIAVNAPASLLQPISSTHVCHVRPWRGRNSSPKRASPC